MNRGRWCSVLGWVLSFALLVSCEKEEVTSVRRSSPGIVLTSQGVSACSIYESRDGARVDPLMCLRESCQRSGGKFEESAQQCRCPSNQYFSGWNGGCLQVSPNPCSREKGGFSNALLRGEDKYNECSNIVEAVQGQFSSFVIDPTSDQFENKLQLAHWLDRNFQRLDRPRLPVFPLKAGRNVILAGPGKVQRSVVQKILLPVEVDLNRRLDHFDFLFDTYFYERDPERFPGIINGEPSRALPEIADPEVLRTSAESSVYSRDEFRIKQALRISYLNSVGQPFSFDSFESRTKDGCAGVCTLKMAIGTGVPGLFARRERDYSGGVVFRDQISIRKSEQDQEAIGLIHLDPAGAASMIFTMNSEKHDTTLRRNVRVYDRSWNLVGGPYTFELVSNFDSSVQKVRLQKNLSGSQGGTVVCEDGFNLARFEAEGMVSKLKVGPAFEPEMGGGGSLFGWLGQTRGDSILYLSGAIGLAASGIPIGIKIREEHSVAITRIITDGFDTQVVPIGVQQCFYDYEKWKRNVLPFRIKAVNVSYYFPIESETCERSMPWKGVIDDPDMPFLWVLGAGNGGALEGRKDTIHHCPQNLADRRNTLVVAASQGERGPLAPYSDRGEAYADIVADGTALGNSGNGTSYAAPRVARLVDKISRTFSDLTVPEIRTALLLGADIPEVPEGSEMGGIRRSLKFLPVRSGGYLSEWRALKIAEEISIQKRKFDKILPDLLIAKMDCDSGETFCERGRDRMLWLQKTGLLQTLGWGQRDKSTK